MFPDDIIIAIICKGEYKYLREFVEYHLNLGFDRIVIADNNDIDGERYDELLADYIKETKVMIFDFRGKQGMQKLFYNNLKNLGIEYEWAAFIDTDEFITFSEVGKKIFGNNIKNFLHSRDYVKAYKLNWLLYGDNGNIVYEDKPVIERFPEPLSKNVTFHYRFPENSHCKSILRYDVPVHFTDNPHGINECDEYFSPKGIPIKGGAFNFDLEYDILYIRHYYTKSLEEWCKNKLGRSYADYLRSDAIDYYPLKDYFIYNKYTHEKEKWLEDNGYKYEKK